MSPSPVDVTLNETCSGVCLRLYPGGMYVKADAHLPALLEPIPGRVQLDGCELRFRCEVVRHVSPADADKWGIPPGCVVQFLEASPALVAALARATAGTTPMPDEKPVDDPELRHLLRSHWVGEDEDHYGLLSLPVDVDFATARQRAKDCRAKLEEARALGLDARDRALLQPAIERVNEAMAVLCDPLRRAEYDAGQKNFRGVARCIAAGLSTADLDTCRRRHLKKTPQASQIALAYVQAALALQLKGQAREALINYERALAIDPLNSMLHVAWERSRRAAPGVAVSQAPAA